MRGFTSKEESAGEGLYSKRMSAAYNILKLAPMNPILLRVVTAGGRRLRHAFVRWGYLGLLVLVLLIAMAGNSSGEQSLSGLAKSSSRVFSAISYVQLGMICLTGTTSEAHMKEDLATSEEPLSDEEIALLENVSGP